MPEVPDLWQKILYQVKSSLPEERFNLWFKDTRLQEVLQQRIFVHVPSVVHAELLEKKYAALIQEASRVATGQSFEFVFTQDNKPPSFTPIPETLHRPAAMGMQKTALIQDFVFESFVIGNCNRFAYSACLAVAEAPGETKFNPLLIYGGTGLGKTHLLNAVGNYIAQSKPKAAIFYCSTEQFCIDFIEALKTNRIADMSRKYRSFDLLLMDDVQFMKGKSATQEEFFHIFNTLQHNRSQIVFSSDKHPKELEGLEERLISRFQSGLTVDIQPPDLETRIAILYKKAEDRNLSIPKEVIDYIANSISGNIRELEGCIIRLLAFSSFKGKEITLEMAESVLDIKRSFLKRKYYTEKIIEAAAEYYHVPPEKITKRGREKEVVLPRQMAMFLARRFTNDPLKKIGRVFGKDHSTIIYACKTIEKLLENSKEIAEDYKYLKEKIKVE